MFGIMLPGIVGYLRPVDVDLVVAIDVDIDLSMVPVAAVPTPDAICDGKARTPEEPAHERRAGVPVPVLGWIGGIPPRSINDGRLVDRNINDVGLGCLDDNVLGLRLRIRLLLHLLLLVRLQIAGLVGL